MPRCPPGSLRSVQLPLDHLVEKRDRAVCHQHSNGRRSQSRIMFLKNSIESYYSVLLYTEERNGIFNRIESSTEESIENGNLK